MPEEMRIHRRYQPLFPDAKGNLSLSTRYCLCTGGRGSGKSYAVALALSLAAQHPGYTILFTRWTMASAKDSIIPEFVEKIEKAQMLGFEVGAHEISHANGSRILFRGIKTSAGNQTAKLKSLQGINLWVVDEAEEMPDERVFDTIDLSVRDGRRPCHVVLVLNPALRTHWIFRRWFQKSSIAQGECGVDAALGATFIHTDYRQNVKNLPADFLKLAEDCRSANLLRYKHIWLGQWVDQREGALWTFESINDNRVDRLDVLPDMVRIVVGVDPAVSSKATSDETGIVVAGKGVNGHYYVFTDLSGRYDPLTWAKKVVGAYEAHKASGIVAEVNQGGDLVEMNIRTVSPHAPVHKVHASRGKIVRAEPIASLYAAGLVHHVGTHRELEAELMTYCGRDNEESPGRLDSCVWAITELSGTPDGSSSAWEIARKSVI